MAHHHNHGEASMSMPMAPPTYNNQTIMSNNTGDTAAAMHMSFFWGKDVVLLFSGWPGSGRLGMYVIALAAVFVLAVGAEILSVAPSLKPRARGLGPAAEALIHAVVFGVRMALAYLVMLSVMSFNLGVFVVAVVGHAVGRFVVKYRQLTGEAAVAAAPARAVESSPKF